jgi:hypothetical protein
MRHLVIPDVQQKPDCSTEHLTWAGRYIVKMLPDVIICIGDFYDMPSLCTYDKGTLGFENRRYLADIEAGNEAMAALLAPMKKLQARQRKNKKQVYNPRMIYTMGNHEYRITRAVNSDAILEDVLTYDHMDLDDWEVFPYLEVEVVDGIAYSHFFTSGVMGRPVSSAKALLTKKHMSCCMGHVQDRDIAYAKRADGTNMTGLFAGIYYQHDEDYLTPQTNGSWKGLWVFNDVKDGSFDELPVSMKYLEEKYG